MEDQPETFELPEWLTEACPSWCDGDHRGQQHADDRKHFAEHELVAVVAQDHVCGFVRGQAPPSYPDEMIVSVFRRVGEWETWVAASTDHQRVEVSLESARRLYDALGRVLVTITD